MKSEINPVAGGIILVIILVIVGAFFYLRSNQDVVTVAPGAAKASKANK